MSRSRRAAGFTLIEVVIATSLLALGLAIAFGTMRSAGRATAKAEASAQREERLRAAQGFLRTQLSSALPIPFEFDGESGAATFLRATPGKLSTTRSTSPEVPGTLLASSARTAVDTSSRRSGGAMTWISRSSCSVGAVAGSTSETS